MVDGLFTEEPSPPEEFEMTYWKTRVERVLEQFCIVPAAKARTLTLNLRRETTMLGAGLDPRHGTLFLLAKTDVPSDVTIRVSVVWLLPNGTQPYTYSTSSALVLNTPQEVRLWDGPVTPDVQVTITASNLNLDVPRTVRIYADVVAKRFGSNFDTGMRLKVADPIRPQSRPVGPIDPEANAHGPVVRPGASCRAGKHHHPPAHGPAGQPRAGHPPPPADPPPPPAPPEWPEQIPGVPGRPPSVRMLPRPAQLGLPTGTVADATIACEDQRDAEVATYIANSFKLIQGGGTTASFAQGGGGLGIRTTFPNDFDAVMRHLPASLPTLDTYVNRCDPFPELWRTVTFGLDEVRMPPSRLRLILRSTPGLAWKSWRHIDDLVPEGTDRDTTAWDWVESYDFRDPLDPSANRTDVVWRHPSSVKTWFMASVLNLMFATADLMPHQMEAERGAAPLFRKRKHCVSGHARCKTNRIRKAQAAWRITGEKAPFLTFRHTHAHQLWSKHLYTPFDISHCNWGAGVFDSAYSYGGGVKAYTYPAPPPVPSVVHLNGWEFLPHMSAAGELYAASRLYTMFAAAVSRAGDRRRATTLVSDAQVLYRAYLSCVAVVAQTAWHELFHTSGSWYPSAEVAGLGGHVLSSGVEAAVGAEVDLIAWAARYRKFCLHCGTGCGQERISMMWFARLAHEYAFYPIVYNGPSGATSGSAILHPAFFTTLVSNDPWSTNLVPFASTCYTGLFGPSVSFRTRFPVWPLEPGDPLTMEWDTFSSDRAGNQTSHLPPAFLHHCEHDATNLHPKTCVVPGAPCG